MARAQAKEFEEKQAKQEEGKGGEGNNEELLEIETLVRAAWPYWVWIVFQVRRGLPFAAS